MKGLHTQGAAILFERAPSLDAFAAALADFDITPRSAPPSGGWMGAAGFLVPFGVGAAVVQPFAEPWPDAMGSTDDAALFGAWTMGFFGPFTYPRGLQRAGQHACGWAGAAAAAGRHAGFVRVVSTYVIGAPADTPVLPEDYDAREEIDLVTRVAIAVARLPGALAYLNPGGEVLVPVADLADRFFAPGAPGLPPLDVWTKCGCGASPTSPRGCSWTPSAWGSSTGPTSRRGPPWRHLRRPGRALAGVARSGAPRGSAPRHDPLLSGGRGGAADGALARGGEVGRNVVPPFVTIPKRSRLECHSAGAARDPATTPRRTNAVNFSTRRAQPAAKAAFRPRP